MKDKIGYIRVSTSKQVGKDKNGLDAQLADITYWFESRNISMDDVEIICDSAKSASKIDKRIGFQTIIERATKKQVKLVVSQCSDRLFRNVSDTVKIGELFKNKDVKIELVRGDFDYSSSNGKLNANIRACFDQNWVDKTREDTFDRMRTAAYKGHYILGGKCPIGFYRDDKKLKVDEEKRSEIINIFELMASNQFSLLSLANHLNSIGALNTNWTDRALETMFKNKIYYGCLDTTRAANKKSNGYPLVVIDNHSPAIINEELWNRTRKAINKKTALYKYLFKNKVMCEKCGSWCTHSSTVKPNKVYLYYCCDTCHKSINENNIMEIALPFLQEEFEKVEKEKGVKILMRKINKYKSLLKSLENDYLEEFIDYDYYCAKKKEYLIESELLQKEVDYINKMKIKAYKSLDTTIKKSIIKNTIKCVKVNFGTKEITIIKMD